MHNAITRPKGDNYLPFSVIFELEYSRLYSCLPTYNLTRILTSLEGS